MCHSLLKRRREVTLLSCSYQSIYLFYFGVKSNILGGAKPPSQNILSARQYYELAERLLLLRALAKIRPNMGDILGLTLES